HHLRISRQLPAPDRLRRRRRRHRTRPPPVGGAHMTMAAFQRAYADLAGSPRLCLAVRADPAAALAPYDLDAREHRRLADIVWQRGMDANCTLYRATRITGLNAVAPL